MDVEIHCNVTDLVMGKKFNEVHKWLDELYQFYENTEPYRHWIERHNIKAVSEKYDEGSHEHSAALLHIICDWISRFSVVNCPSTQEDVINKLRKYGVNVNALNKDK